MDTRSKIVTLEQAQERAGNRPTRWVSGHFDPLLAEHVRHLRQSTSPGHLLIVKVTNPAQPLLSQRARAELVAALSMVDYVVLGDGELHSADASITERFVEHVLRRHRGEGA